VLQWASLPRAAAEERLVEGRALVDKLLDELARPGLVAAALYDHAQQLLTGCR